MNVSAFTRRCTAAAIQRLTRHIEDGHAGMRLIEIAKLSPTAQAGRRAAAARMLYTIPNQPSVVAMPPA